jgi:hypothetical protein
MVGEAEPVVQPAGRRVAVLHLQIEPARATGGGLGGERGGQRLSQAGLNFLPGNSGQRSCFPDLKLIRVVACAAFSGVGGDLIGQFLAGRQIN